MVPSARRDANRPATGARTRSAALRAVPCILAAMGATVALAGCAGPPAINVVGSYFPAWMLCALIGAAAAVCLRAVLIPLGVDDDLALPLVAYAALALATTLAVWLVWFGH